MATDQARYKFMRNWRRANLQIRDGIVSGTIDGKRFGDGPLDEFLDQAMEHAGGGTGAAARTNVAPARRTASAGSTRSAGSGGAGRTGSKSGATRGVGRPRKAMAGTT